MGQGVDKREFKELDNVSVTGYRIISILKMLLEKPCSDIEINEKFQEDTLSSRDLSQDTICIYINTLRAIGCNISRPTKNTNYKYVLKSQPYLLKLSEEEISSLIKIVKYISGFNDWKLMVSINKLFKTIYNGLHPDSKKIFDSINKPRFLNIYSNMDSKIISSLEKYCEEKRTILLNYLSPDSGEKFIEIVADKLAYENGVMHLWGYNLKLKDTQYLRVDRIKDIKVVKLDKAEYKPKSYSIVYKLTGLSYLTYVPVSDEMILEKNDEQIIIEANIKNKFRYLQKLLAYGSDCTVLYPEDIKNEVIEKLKSMLKVYKQSSLI